MKAAAKSYFGKSLANLTLAQDAILAAIPQSPTKFDLMRNATEVCLEDVAEGQECTKFKLIVPQDSEVVQRRNKVLDLMETRSTLTGNKHTLAEYEAAKNEPVELVQQVSAAWKAPHFVWQVRRDLATLLCPDSPTDCPKVDTGGYKVITTLDWTMQKTAEKWVYVAARAPNAKNPSAILSSRKIPRAARSWIMGLRGHNINNAAAAVEDYRTGEILAYVGSASYTSKGSKKFQPQFDVLSDGWRQPGSAIKPVDYAIGIDDKTLTASTMFMDVTTNFGGGFIPTQADHLERGPVRLRSALQFSLNIPAIKATIMSGLDHVYDRTKDFGLTYPKTALPVLSEGIGTLEVHPIDLLGAYGTIANSGVLMPHRYIGTVLRQSTGEVVWPKPDEQPKGKRVTSAGAAYILTDILAGNTDKKVNPFWGKWAIYNGKTRRPAAYKTGTTSDNRDVAAYGFLAPPADKKAPALAVGVWMGNSDNSPNDGKLSLDTSAPLWSAIMTEVSKGMKIAQFKPPQRPQVRHRRRLHRPQARPVHEEDGQGAVPAGHGPDRRRRRSGSQPRSTRRPGSCGGTAAPDRRSPRASSTSPRSSRTSRLAEGQRQLGRPGGQGLRRAWRPEGHPDGLLLQRRVHAVRPDLGCAVQADRAVPALHAAAVLRPVRAHAGPVAPPNRPASPLPTPPPFGGPTNKPFPTRKPRETPRPR